MIVDLKKAEARRRNLRILLVMPDAKIHRLHIGLWKMSFREAPLTLTTLAALVPPDLDAHIRIVDESVDRLPWNAPFDLVGISCLTGTALRAYELADHFRARGVPVVLGGVHVTLRPDEAAPHADALVTGFAEQTWPRLLEDFVAGRLHPVYEADGVDLAGLPDARRDLQKRTGYIMPRTMHATRGCSKTCDFCTIPALGCGFHRRPVGEVIDELRRLGRGRIAFNDVALDDDPEYARELFTAMIPLRLKWGGLSTSRVADDEELLDLMHRSGCSYLLIGLESFANRDLQKIRKGFNRAEDYEVPPNCGQGRRLATHGYSFLLLCSMMFLWMHWVFEETQVSSAGEQLAEGYSDDATIGRGRRGTSPA